MDSESKIEDIDIGKTMCIYNRRIIDFVEWIKLQRFYIGLYHYVYLVYNKGEI